MRPKRIFFAIEAIIDSGHAACPWQGRVTKWRRVKGAAGMAETATRRHAANRVRERRYDDNHQRV